jgi:DNA mismatch endonuclease (patch repair protein)
MARVHSANTTPEVAARKVLHAAGFRFRLHVRKLPGNPDIVLSRYKTIVFVHGCLWHWHGCKRSRMPSTNVFYWKRKIRGNVKRDRANMVALRQAGWDVEVVWECELQNRLAMLVRQLAQRRVLAA